MAGKKQRDLPSALAKGRKRFQAWRRRRKPGARIPEPLWALAVKLARAHGIGRTTSTLGLDYYSLKKRLEATTGEQQATNDTFIELPAPAGLHRQCTIELSHRSGATMRLCLAGYDGADVARLARGVWNGE